MASGFFRLQFGWEQRSQDFECYRPPPIHFGPPPPPSIHLGGASRTRELQEFLDREQEEWSTKVVVKDTQFHALRRGIVLRNCIRIRLCISMLLSVMTVFGSRQSASNERKFKR